MTVRHVLFVNDAYEPEIGGVERVCRELALALVAAGVRVTVVARAVEGRPNDETVDGVGIRRYPHVERVTPRAWLSHARGSAAVVRRILAVDAPDLVHCHLSLSAQGALSALPLGFPVVAGFYGRWDREFDAEVRDMDRGLSPARRIYYAAQNRARRAMQRRLLSRSRLVVPLSDFSRREAVSLAPWIAPRLRKVPAGLDARRFLPRTPRSTWPDGPRLLTVRRLVRRMGIDSLLDAVAVLRDRVPGLRLDVAGGGPEAGALRERARALRLDDRVQFLGFVPEPDLPALYASCDVFVVPTRAQENFGLPVLEAAACACPVVATPVGSLPEIMAMAGSPYLSADNSAAGLASAIERALSELARPAIRARLVRDAERVRAEWDWSRVARSFLELYEDASSCASR